jgi:DNA-binding NtrC family response regulator
MRVLLTVGLSGEEAASLQEILAGRGWEIRSASGWTQVFLRLRERSYRAVICESSLPDGDWRDVLDELRLCTLPPPLIVTSPFADAHLWAEVLDAGGYDVLPYPFEARELIRVLEQMGSGTPAREPWKPPELVPAGRLWDED